MFKAQRFLKIIALMSISIGFGGCSDKPQYTIIGQPIQTINMVDEQNVSVNFQQLASKPTLVYFWATWCKPCFQSISVLDQLQKEDSPSFQIVLVSLDDDLTKARLALRKLRYHHIQWFAVKGTTHLKQNDFGNDRAVLPYTLLLNRNMEIIQSGIYAKSKNEWQQKITQYL